MIKTKEPLPMSPIHFWVIWAGMMSSVFFFLIVFGGDIIQPQITPPDSMQLIAILSGGLVIGASAVRWILIPRTKDMRHLFTLMIIGLALSEPSGLLALLFLPKEPVSTRMMLWALSFLSVFQFIPIYLKSVQSHKNPLRP